MLKMPTATITDTVQRQPAWVVAPMTLIASLMAAYAVTLYPILFIPVIGLAGLLTLTTMQDHIGPIFMVSVGALVLGYMFMGKGFSYVGAPPLYVGELVLGLGVLAVIIARVRIQLTVVEVILLMFMLLGLARTIPYVGSEGIMALRDAAMWYYGIYAILVSIFFTERRLRIAVRAYGKVLPALLIWFAIMPFAIAPLEPVMPIFPGSPEPLISVTKPGDRAVILVSLAAFVIAGLYARRPNTRPITPSTFWALWLSSALLVSATNRGGMLSIVCGVVLLVLLKPSRAWLQPTVLAVAGVAAVIVWNPTIDTGNYRQLSAQQLTTNFVSIFSNDTENLSAVQGTKAWRLQWWSDIVRDNTSGPEFWSGQGFGLNLANEYGYQTDKGDTLRSPHNIHVTILARMGVPGVALWAMLQLAFANQMIQAFRTARDRGDRFWASVFAWILPIWLAVMVRSSFDVYLEGPQGAIPFWCLVGLGIGAMRLQHQKIAAEAEEAATSGGGRHAYPAGS